MGVDEKYTGQVQITTDDLLARIGSMTMEIEGLRRHIAALESSKLDNMAPRAAEQE